MLRHNVIFLPLADFLKIELLQSCHQKGSYDTTATMKESFINEKVHEINGSNSEFCSKQFHFVISLNIRESRLTDGEQ